ncbi:T9SS type A sorting domain-containing protein [Ekhidna sp.]|jgi:hypothetical protein|uniref:T9SS type A sorting domain-containing protein n=1 Tax=Ekhidna sp. TaxID=2608089 RepID=UPI0032EF962B
MKNLFVASIVLFFAFHAGSAQTFESISLSFKEIISDGSMNVADFDNDGDQDVVISGLVEHILEGEVADGGVGFVGVYENNEGEFNLLEDQNLIELWSSDVAFGDFDNDLDMDLIVSGKPTGPATSNTRVLKVYKNNGDKSFTEVTVDIEAISAGDIDLIDFNNDDLLDVAITGGVESEFGSSGFTDIYINEGDFVFTPLNLPVAQLSGSSEIDFIDIENDGDYDIILTGFDERDFSHKTFFYEQTEDDYILTDIGFPNLSAAAIGIADLDGNGFDDVVLSGGSSLEPYNNLFFIYLNNEGAFTSIETEVGGTEDGNLDFADFDIDGDLDILLSGGSGPSINDPSVTKIIVNHQGESFSVFDIEEELSGSFRGGVKWGDFDGDMDVDILKIQGGSVLYKQNFNPQITGIAPSFNTQQNQSFEIAISDLKVKDVDNTFPEDFSLSIHEGSSYKIEGSSIIATGDSKKLSIPVSVNDGENQSDQFEVLIDIENLLKINHSTDNFLVYPIPFNNHLNLKSTSDDQSPFEIRIYTIDGVLVSSAERKPNHTLDLSYLNEGTYFIQIASDKEVIFKKLVKNK